MSLDNIQLPGFVIQDLFQKTLIDLTTDKGQLKDEQKELNFFGGNKQHISLLVNAADSVYINDHLLTFLSGILNACKLTLEDIAIVNIHSYPQLSYKKVIKELNPKIVMMFGIAPDKIELPFTIPEFQKQTFDGQIYLSSPSLEKLEKDKELKKKLWITLQQIFSL